MISREDSIEPHDQGAPMKIVWTALLMSGLVLPLYAAEKTGDASAAEAAPSAASAPAAPGAADTASPAAPATDVKTDSPETKPGADKAAAPAETAKDAAKPAPDAAMAQPIGFVAPLQDLLAYHKKEIASLKQLIQQWNSRVGAMIQREQGMQQDVKAKTQKIADLEKENTKAGKREAARVTKDIARITKEIGLVKKERAELQREFMKELREISKESQQGLKDAYQQTTLKVSQTSN
jgi:hypothetical protein